MQTVSCGSFTTVTTEGTILPADLLQRIVDGRELSGLRPVDYHLVPDDWLNQDTAEQLLQVEPDANVNPQQATRFLERVVGDLPELQGALSEMANQRAQDLLAAHERVRAAARMKGISHSIRPQSPVDVLGVYMLLPVGN